MTPLARSIVALTLGFPAMLLFATPSAAQTPVKNESKKSAATFMDSIPRWMASSHVPGVAIATLAHGKVATVRTFGELRPGVPLPENALFNVASLTKPVVAVTTLRLVSSGSLKLTESLAPFWVDPDVADNPAHNLITPRLILSHQTGFPNWRWLTPSKKLQFLSPPGTAFRYSGEGYEYLRKALENKYDRTLQQLADSMLFKPAGMRESTFGWNPASNAARFAVGHDTNGAETAVVRRPMDQPNAADWLVTTIGDYSRFAQYVLGGGGLAPTVYAEMVKPQIKFAEGSNESMGLGWEILSGPATDQRILLHTGSDDGIKTMIVLLPQSRRGVVVFTTGDNGMEVVVKILKASLNLKELTP